MTDIRVRHYSFDLGGAFSAGHVCSPQDAEQLETARAEALRPRIYRLVTSAEGQSPGGVLTQDQIVSIQSRIDEMVASFVWSTNKMDKIALLDRISREIAASRLPSEAPPEDITSLAESPEIIEEARRRIVARDIIVNIPLDELI